MTDSLPITSGAVGEPRTTKSVVLEAGAAATQGSWTLHSDENKHIEANYRSDVGPVTAKCAHLNAILVYASEPTRCEEAIH